MSVNFPGSLDNGTSIPNPNTTDKRNNPSHAGLHGLENSAIIAAETKLGTGASTPIANSLLFGTGTGTSAWTQLTSAQLAGTLTDETGTGSAVFGTTPTLVTPKVDTINESTPSNGTTIGGVNIKSGALNTNNSVVTANITDAAVTPAKLVAGTGSTWNPASWSPTLTGFSVNPTSTVYRYIQMGKIVHMWIIQGGTGTSNSGALSISLPVSPAATVAGMNWGGVCRVADNGVSAIGSYFVASAGTTATFGKDAAGNVFTSSGGKSVSAAYITYEVA